MMNREWIKSNNRASIEYREGIDAFIRLASSQEGVNGRIRCPCNKCRNTEFKPTVEVRLHLLRNGFNKSYTTWFLHGEKLRNTIETFNANCDEHLNNEVQMDDVDDLIGLVHDAYAFESVNSSQMHEEMFAETPNEVQRTRYLENMREEVQRAVESARESMFESVKADVMKNLQKEMRANVIDELSAEIRKTVKDELKTYLTVQIQSQFDAMFQARMAAFLGSSSQSADTSVPTKTRATNSGN